MGKISTMMRVLAHPVDAVPTVGSQARPPRCVEIARRWSSRILTISLIAFAGFAGGCLSQPSVTLYQSFAPSGQRELRLRDARVSISSKPDSRTIAAVFSRPGSDIASRDFVLYLVVPPGNGEWVADPNSSGGVRGFLIQAVGELRGKTTIAGGSIVVQRHPWPNHHEFGIDIALRCEDETRIVGHVTADEAAYQTLLVERRYAADVVELVGRDDLTEGDSSLPYPTPPRSHQ